MKAPFGWTVIASSGAASARAFIVYKRDCPPDAAHFADDLAPFTHATKAAAEAAGRRGEFAYKREI